MSQDYLTIGQCLEQKHAHLHISQEQDVSSGCHEVRSDQVGLMGPGQVRSDQEGLTAGQVRWAQIDLSQDLLSF